MPPAASLGETVVIECSYHLQGEEVGERVRVMPNIKSIYLLILEI